MIFDFLPGKSRRWPLISGSGPDGSQSRRGAVPGEPKWEPMVIGVSCREHVNEPQVPGKDGSPLLRAVHSHNGNLRVDARQIA